ncbi:MAG: universal stress protein [Pseudomonadota bacterium]
MSREKLKILAAVDGSEQSLRAVSYLSEFLSPTRTEVTIFHVVKTMPQTFRDLEQSRGFPGRDRLVGAWEEKQDAFIRDFMDRAVEALVTAGFSRDNIRVKVTGLAEGVARDILREAAAGLYDAAVVGGSGLGKIKDLLLGTVADKLLGNLHHIPLCIVSGRPDPTGMLLALDASECSKRAASFAVSLAENKARETRLLHVVKTLGFPREIPEAKELVEAAQQALEEEARAVMAPLFDEIKRRLVKAGPAEKSIVSKVETGAPSRAWAIIEEARSTGTGTIILGRRGLSKFEEYLLGRVGAKVARLAKNQAVWVVN